MTDDEDTREDRKHRFHTVLRVIASNTGDPQPPLQRARHLWTTAVANGSLSQDEAATALSAAREHGYVLQWVDPDGDVRYGLTDSGITTLRHADAPLFEAADEPALRDIIEREAGTDDPDRDVIGWANKRLAALEG